MDKRMNKKLMNIYNLMLDKVGPRHWWPADTKFEMIVGAVLAQLYIKRVFCKLGIFNEEVTYDEMQRYFMDNLTHDTVLFNEFHAQIDGAGSNYCFGKTPKCVECPVEPVCKR